MGTKDISVTDCNLYFCPITTRVPLKFGTEVTTQVVSARASLSVTGKDGHTAQGWGETPLSVAWVWPKDLSTTYRQDRLKRFCCTLRDAWKNLFMAGHPMEIGHWFINNRLQELWKKENSGFDNDHQMPWLAALACNSLFDIALHDAYGMYHKISTWDTYTETYMNWDLSRYYTEQYAHIFAHHHPADFLLSPDDVPKKLVAWHLVGAKDPVTEEDTGSYEVSDGYPVTLTDWIRKDGLKCIKVKLTGLDAAWDYERLVSVGKVAIAENVNWLSADFNCTVHDPQYVCSILDQLLREYPRIYGMILYIEQPFPYDIESNPIDVHAVSARKPLFMDESAHDWRYLSYGRNLGWTGVALKTCKTLTGALLSFCWAKSHGMTIMVQDLTNPMLAQIAHVQLAAHCGTIMGVETNAMQFYPEISQNEMRIHPGLYIRRNGCIHLDSLGATGMGYRYDEIEKARILAGEPGLWEKA